MVRFGGPARRDRAHHASTDKAWIQRQRQGDGGRQPCLLGQQPKPPRQLSIVPAFGRARLAPPPLEAGAPPVEIETERGIVLQCLQMRYREGGPEACLLIVAGLDCPAFAPRGAV